MMKKTITVITAAILAATSAVAIAAPTANGKNAKNPFVMIEGQIQQVQAELTTYEQRFADLQAQLNTATQLVVALEADLATATDNYDAIAAELAVARAAVVAIQQQIADLQAVDAAIWADLAAVDTRLDSLEASRDTNNQQIATLQQQVGNLQQQVADLSVDITANAGQIAGLNAQINQLGVDINALVAQQIALINNSINELWAKAAILESAIAGNSGDIQAFQSELTLTNTRVAILEGKVQALETGIALKQDIINGTCNSGEAIGNIQPDGSVSCVATGGGTSGALSIVTVSSYRYVAPGYNYGYVQGCPAGTKIISGGYFAYGMNTYSERLVGNGWLVSVTNTDTSYGHDLYVFANCAQQ